MRPIRVVVQGASGRMGKEVVDALCREPGIEVVGATRRHVISNSLALPDGSGSVPLSNDLNSILNDVRPDVLVDFTIAAVTMPSIRIAARKGINLVIGTTGLSDVDLGEIEQLAGVNNIGAVFAPNFALGAVLMMHLANIATAHLDNAEITELHYDQKADAPSGTALMTARRMATIRSKPFLKPSQTAEVVASRGQVVDGITIHSVRLPGLVAHQEVVFGASGQTLTIRHDSTSRESFVPGVILAVKEVVKRKGLTVGLAALMGLEETP